MATRPSSRPSGPRSTRVTLAEDSVAPAALTVGKRQVLISAHRGGAGTNRLAQNTLSAFARAIEMGCDYVEFDVQRAASGYVVQHDGTAPIAGVDLDAVLTLLKGRAKAHVDLKFAGAEIDAVRHIVATLGPGNAIITTAEDESIAVIRQWARLHAPELLVGLSTSARGGGLRRQDRLSAWFPRRRLRRSGANLVVSHHAIARWWLRAYARRHALPLLVWTVDDRTELTRWMNDPHTWMVTTNYPSRAFAARHRE